MFPKQVQHISQEKGEEDLPEGVMSVSLLKHQVTFSLVSVPQLFCLFWRPSSLHDSMFFYVSKKMALAWMLSKENSSHCLGGILADDQVISYFSTLFS